jgi:cell division protein FtsL
MLLVSSTLVNKLSEWLISRAASVFLALLLVTMLLASSVGVIYVVHKNRQLYGELQNLKKQQDFLDHEYEKLLLEQSAWSEYSRIEKVSQAKLAMRIPAANEIVMVQESDR